MKKLFAILSVTGVLALIPFSSARAEDGCRIAGYDSCGRPIYQIFHVHGYDSCGRPIGHWVTQYPSSQPFMPPSPGFGRGFGPGSLPFPPLPGFGQGHDHGHSHGHGHGGFRGMR